MQHDSGFHTLSSTALQIKEFVQSAINTLRREMEKKERNLLKIRRPNYMTRPAQYPSLSHGVKCLRALRHTKPDHAVYRVTCVVSQ